MQTTANVTGDGFCNFKTPMTSQTLIQWNPGLATSLIKDHPSFKTICLEAKLIYTKINPSWETILLLRPYIFVFWVVLKEGFHCSSSKGWCHRSKGGSFIHPSPQFDKYPSHHWFYRKTCQKTTRTERLTNSYLTFVYWLICFDSLHVFWLCSQYSFSVPEILISWREIWNCQFYIFCMKFAQWKRTELQTFTMFSTAMPVWGPFQGYL